MFSAEALQKMAEKLPITKEDMLEIGGVTEYKFNRFDGEQFLNITRTYMTINGTSWDGKKLSAFYHPNCEGMFSRVGRVATLRARQNSPCSLLFPCVFSPTKNKILQFVNGIHHPCSHPFLPIITNKTVTC